MNIEFVTFVDSAMPVGAESTPVGRLMNGGTHDLYKVKLAFSEDPRFIEVLLSKGSGNWLQLVPLTQVRMVVVSPDGRKFRDEKTK